MKFVCESCGAQYVIADEKVGPKGVKVRCKKCSHVIVVKPALAGADAGAEAGADATVVIDNPLADLDGKTPDAGEAFSGDGAEAEIGMAFDTIFGDGEGPGLAAMGPTDDEPGTQPEGDPFSSAVDDAFDAALGEPAPEAHDDHAATRIFSTQDIQRVAQEREIADDTAGEEDWPGPNGHAAAAPPAAVEGADEADWYVAVGDEQVGPLTPTEVQGRWEAGDISPDSLVWKPGMADWMPLSTVDELKDLIAPAPDAGGWSAGPGADEEPAPSLSSTPAAPAASASADDEAAEWKPAAASLLASLAAEEMDALDKQASEPELAAPTADPVGPAPVAPAPEQAATPAIGGLDLDLPPPPAPAPDAFPEPPGPGRIPTPAPRPVATYAEPMRPATSTGMMAAAPPGVTTHLGGLTTGKLAAIVGGAVVLAVGLVFGVLAAAGVFSSKAAGTAPVAVAKTATPAPAKTAATAPAAATPSPAKTAAPPKTAAPAATATAAKTAAPAAATPAKTPSKTPTEVASAKTPAPSHAQRHHRRAPRHERHPRTERRVAEATPRHTRQRAAAADPLASTNDDDALDKELFGSSDSGSKPKPSHRGRHRPSSYIPPAPGGGGDLPRALGQGDIMQVVAQHMGALKSCAAQQRSANANVHGNLVMSWRIRPSGRTASVGCTRRFRSTVMCKCLTRVIHGMRFPRYGGPQMPGIDFPFKF